VARATQPSDLGVRIGQVFLGKYRVESILGHGAMGIVAKCTHLTLNEAIAIKMLRKEVLSDRDAHERFMREAQAAAKLRSEYVARVTDVGTFENNVPYIVMEFLDGLDLDALLEERGALQAPWASELMLQAAEALAEAHSINIVHRDVKPSNLFVTWRPDGTALIKVLDFGISKSVVDTDLSLTQTQSLLGTPAYMSPEQMRSARMVDARSDIWSLGTVFYELLENRKPFEADSFSEMCVKVAVDPPAPMVNAPLELQDIVLRCLAKAPEQRYQSMAELGHDLVPFCQNQQQATILVERMQRMLRRSGVTVPADFDIATSGGVRIPREARDLKSGPIPRTPPIARPASTPSEVIELPRSKWPLAMLAFVVLGGAIAVTTAFMMNGEHTKAAASAPITQSAPAAPTPVPSASTPAPSPSASTPGTAASPPAPTTPPSTPVVTPEPPAPAATAAVEPPAPETAPPPAATKPGRAETKRVTGRKSQPSKAATKPPPKQSAAPPPAEVKEEPKEAPKPKCNVFDTMHPGDCAKSR
jgi:eukaryotic-like serine/threonine-protein kinase